MWDNKLSGKIPVTLSNLSQLTLLDLSVNKLEGEVPSELGMLKNLEILYFHSNDLGGGGGSGNSSLSFLTALTNCSVLKKLHFASCLFRGNIPSSVGGLSKDLFYFNLRNNDITGSIPDSIGNLSSLVSLYMSINNLEGRIPASIGMLGNLQRLYLEKNRILGPIPDDLGKMSSLGLLDLGKNLIGGSIPPSLGNLSQLRYLNLSTNRLSGKVPVKLTKCSLMMMLDLSFNMLQGSVPEQIGLLSHLELSLNLSNNHFEGQIPASIGKLVSLQAMDFSKNKFSGVIPSVIGSCISVVYLNLSNNMLEGTIPESLKLITYLEVLDLSHNQLNGTVPIWIADEKMIKNINLSYNRLSGEVPITGRITFLNSSSFLGNMGLCGGSALLGLPPCEDQKQKGRIKNWIIFSAVAAVVVGCLLVAFVVHRFRNDRKPAHGMLMTLLGHQGSRTFTQRELETATLGFNEAYLLGRGTFGSVYKGIIDNGAAPVAVKVLHGEAITDNGEAIIDNQSFKSFKRECQIMSEIKHRNLVGLVGYAWNTGFKALVLEFISNGNLGQHLYPGGGEEEGDCKLTLRERMSIAVDIANGLEYLQEGCPVQVIHCDLKPENVLIDTNMVAHVADFGIGKLISADKPKEHASTTGFLRGSIGYIPPEYGQGIEVSTKGDVYSFGVVLLELITRKRPTSNMFSDGLDLRKWVSSAFPDQILDVVDTTLKQEAHPSGTRDLEKVEECSIQMLEIGMACTEENPQKRPPMSSIVSMLIKCLERYGSSNCDSKKTVKLLP